MVKGLPSRKPLGLVPRTTGGQTDGHMDGWTHTQREGRAGVGKQHLVILVIGMRQLVVGKHHAECPSLVILGSGMRQPWL